MKVHTEQTFEAEIEAHLLAHGYGSSNAADFDRDQALFPQLVIDFVQTTQPKVWEKLGTILQDELDALFIKEVCKVMDQRGSLEALRHGFTFYGKKVRLAFFKPGHRKNPDLWTLYGQNCLSVVRQLRYDPNNDNELDLVLCLNGVPVVTCELKNALTGQKAGHAKRQYKTDRDPKAPIFVFKKRALVHFAVDADEAYMTTQLKGVDTHFLPFNRGHDNGAGNPSVEGKHRTSYLWEQVCEQESLLDIVGRFMHLQKESGTNPNTGKKWSKETMIFPRYHQLDCLRKLEAGSRINGAGTNYLVQHSAGSGKSNSIAWLAHRLASLHDETDQKVYHSVVVLTDRRVLDQQLQNTIYQFDHKDGVVEKIDKHSDQLATALATGTPIIVSTIHKFGFIQDKVGALPDRRYAIIVDEAHSSQSGEMAVNVKELLSTIIDAINQRFGLDLPDHINEFLGGVSDALVDADEVRLGAEAVQEVPQHEEVTNPSAFDWAALDGRTKPSPGLFVAQVVGESMNRRIPNGAWCVWRLNPTGSRKGKVVLVQHNDIEDRDLGSYTVKLYDSEKKATEGESWRHSRITLKPESSDPTYEPLVFEDLAEGELRIIAELVEVLG